MPANFSITPLPLVEPVERGSRGRNGPFTATSVQVDVHLPTDRRDAPPFCSISAYSKRQGNQPPAEITLSLGDAVELARLIEREVARVLGVSAQLCPHCGSTVSYIPTGTADEHCARCGELWPERPEEATHAP